MMIPHQIESKRKSVFADEVVVNMIPEKNYISALSAGEVEETHEINVEGLREMLVRSVSSGPSLVVLAVLYGHHVRAVVDLAAQVRLSVRNSTKA